MPTDPQHRAALEAAASKICAHVELPQPEPLRFADRVEARRRIASDVAAAAIAAFLRALPDGTIWRPSPRGYDKGRPCPDGELHALAAAVEAAARDE